MDRPAQAIVPCVKAQVAASGRLTNAALAHGLFGRAKARRA